MNNKCYVNICLDTSEDDSGWQDLRIDNKKISFFQEGLIKGFRGKMKQVQKGHMLRTHWIIEFFADSVFSVKLYVVFSEEETEKNNRNILYKAIWQLQNDSSKEDIRQCASEWIRGSKSLVEYKDLSDFKICFDGGGFSMISGKNHFYNFQRTVVLACLCLSYNNVFNGFIKKLSDVDMNDYNALSDLTMNMNIFAAKWYFRYPVLLKNNLVPVLWGFISERFKLNQHYEELENQLKNVHALVSQLYRDQESKKSSNISFKMSFYLVFLTILLVVLTLFLVL
ncbi:hypothetical protein B1757_03230 [Acidithiobacillus marinus]|uniref:Uncharacterized protein n=1 Tax=Acidithiobacillus marinus TaxID=187490 RepID=A0A2I1DP39_9PROT|nr:hypothetical protein [Acidithiobacillus marinus]PKY11648.1 hypothetical protein B1757_03230 [Acidithiobacillus marinus]